MCDAPAHPPEVGLPRTKPGFAVLLTPIARVDQAIEELAFCESIRRSLRAGSSVRLDALNLASHCPAIPRENILVVASKHDLFAPAETVEDLWRSWGKPDIWHLPQGHISVLFSRGTMRGGGGQNSSNSAFRPFFVALVYAIHIYFSP